MIRKVFLFLCLIAVGAGYYIYTHKQVLNIKTFVNKENIPNVTHAIQLKGGNKILGTVIKETTDAVVFRSADGTMELSILKSQISDIRKLTEEELKTVRDKLNKSRLNLEGLLQDTQKRQQELEKFYDERYKKEVESAQKLGGGRDGAPSINLIRESKRKGQIVSGMSESDVIDVYGQPDSKATVSLGGGKKKEKWSYRRGEIFSKDIYFYDGRVE